ncbi:hypothetical protein DL98DRAFT_597985 [Cadophora sp. DSE1049]|nr:hypothetical protein DL98DRAFT_597985 [Cadophora sp. DSE1049]
MEAEEKRRQLQEAQIVRNISVEDPFNDTSAPPAPSFLQEITGNKRKAQPTVKVTHNAKTTAQKRQKQVWEATARTWRAADKSHDSQVVENMMASSKVASKERFRTPKEAPRPKEKGAPKPKVRPGTPKRKRRGALGRGELETQTL